mmetsp:Transcript_32528/g.63664  ORF Transcript_32528/g.63664 Transcript_32528/m.63664 type:complete len:268 (-) Transcript_32528:1517-2320(-)
MLITLTLTLDHHTLVSRVNPRVAWIAKTGVSTHFTSSAVRRRPELTSTRAFVLARANSVIFSKDSHTFIFVFQLRRTRVIGTHVWAADACLLVLRCNEGAFTGADVGGRTAGSQVSRTTSDGALVVGVALYTIFLARICVTTAGASSTCFAVNSRHKGRIMTLTSVTRTLIGSKWHYQGDATVQKVITIFARISFAGITTCSAGLLVLCGHKAKAVTLADKRRRALVGLLATAVLNLTLVFRIRGGGTRVVKAGVFAPCTALFVSSV